MSRIIWAADDVTLGGCKEIVSQLGDRLYAVKIHNLIDRRGPDAIRELREAGAPRVFADMKLHDIPNTVRNRARELSRAGAEFITVHVPGGIEMMRAADEFSAHIIGVTVLTSLSEEEAHLTYGQPAKAAVLNFARLAELAGIHGVVCSPKEVGILSKRPDLENLTFFVPGIRSAGKDVGDQKRVDTPLAALKAGADYLVIGRQITEAADPIAAVAEIEAEIAEFEAAEVAIVEVSS